MTFINRELGVVITEHPGHGFVKDLLDQYQNYYYNWDRDFSKQ